MNGRLVSAPSVETIAANGHVVIQGLSSGQASRLSRLLQAQVTAVDAPVVTVVPQEAMGAAGDRFTVDVYISGVADLRTYQVALDTWGGATGSLTREDLSVDVDRADYVFGAAQAIQASDPVHGRIGAVLFDGSVDAADSRYLGSYTFQASRNASGTFTIGVQPGGNTFLADSRTQRMPFRTAAATVTVGAQRRLNR